MIFCIPQLADIVGDKALHGMLLETTFRNLRILQLSERLKTETSERSLLKNLGSWLGKLTLARNKPILFKDLDLKTILYDAYEQGKMIAVLPFINKASICSANPDPESEHLLVAKESEFLQLPKMPYLLSARKLGCRVLTHFQGLQPLL